MNNISSDIESHLEKIIVKIDFQAFDNIVSKYNERVDQYQKVEHFLKNGSIEASEISVPSYELFKEYLTRHF